MSRFVSLMAAGLLVSAATASPYKKWPTKRTDNSTGMAYSFQDVPSSAELSWVPCYDKFQCANLEVPLDYAEPSAGTIVVAWVRQNAVSNDTASEKYKRTDGSTGLKDVLINPGGPGGSGIDLILAGGGDEIMTAGGNTFNIVSFDPRGVNNSGIALTCFPESSEDRGAFFSLTPPPTTLNEGYSLALAFGQWCTQSTNATQVRYGGTSAVVQDMMHFTELQAALNGVEDPKQADIWYYGISYGTVIGHTLATMFPDRIGRLVVDSNVNSEDYYNGLVKSSINTHDKAYEYFFNLCAEAGPEKCPFAGNSTSGGEIKTRFDNLLAKLEKTPLVSSDLKNNPQGPGTITKADVLNVGFQVMYSPSSGFDALAFGFDGLEKGNASAWFDVASFLRGQENPGPFNYTGLASQEVLTLVTSVDAAGRYPIKNVDDYVAAAEEVKKASIYGGESYAKSNVVNNAGMMMMPPQSQFFEGQYFSPLSLCSNHD